MANKLEKKALDQINKIDEGLFSGFLNKLVSKKLDRHLKMLEKDPALRDSFRRFEKAVDDLERDFETSAEILKTSLEDDTYDGKRNYPKLFKDLGLL